MPVCAALVFALAFCAATAPAAGATQNRAVTAAGTRSFHGTVKPHGTVAFRAKIRHGKPVKVKGSPSHPGFAWAGLPIECATGRLPGDVVSGYFPFSIKLEGRRFHAKGSNGYTTARVRGRFMEHGRKAKGTLRLHGVFPSLDASGCDTGKDHWSAHRVPD